ncbi:MAG: hypothetical protein [Vetruanivirus porcinprimi]|uniref:Uncharacterized protein n=1 Tax=phage Lak_Megaphage_RVC_AP1_GC26 TaxID=3109224 RepID=A0ABZ0Z5I3_9CAUD|nr:MAG: hypothetical protein [phage Lak_Megaphage_RVC_AP1_GC26]
MNKLIKRLIESLFDDIDDIVDNDTTQSVFTQKVIDDELNTLKNKPWNKTEYPSGYSDLDNAENLYKIGELYISPITQLVPYMRLDYYEIRCKFAGYNINDSYDCVEIYIRNHKICSIYVTDNIIHKIIIYADDNNDCEYVKYGIKKRFVDINTYFLMNVYIKNNYTVEKVFIDFEDGIPSKRKDIIMSSTNDYPITSDNLSSYVNTFVMSSTNDQKPISISKVWKTSYITFEYPNVFDTLKSFDDFLNFLKNLGFKKYRMNSQPSILQPSKYKGFEYGEDLFNQFVIDNNFEQCTFKDFSRIENIINKETILYLQNKGYNVPTYNYWTSIYYGSKDKGEQGKDEHGNFMKVKYMFEFDDKETNKHIYSVNIWKFYKSGLCLLDKEVI